MFTIDKENIDTKSMLILMIIAYLFSIAVRMIWVYQFSGTESFYWNNQLMINTNDGYIWGSSALHALSNQFEHNPRIVDMFQYGTVFFTYLAAKILPFSLDTIMLYMPAVISSLVVIPIILLARIYNLTLWGFFAALIGSIAWSYYNRTMVGYYDTDMFSAMAPMFILFFLMRTIEDESLNNALWASLLILVYPFLYDAGLSIVYAMGLIYMVYMIVFHRQDNFTYQSIILISIAMLGVPWFIKLLLIGVGYFVFKTQKLPLKQLMLISGGAVLLFLISGNVFSLIWGKIAGYAIRGVESEGLKFYQVAQTVREAGKIPFETMANRISGSSVGVIVSLIGYIFLVLKYRPFILALPLIGIGVFSLVGGLRFTVYAVPVAAMSAVFLFYLIAQTIQGKLYRYLVITTLTIGMLIPNIKHIIGYQVPTVLNLNEVKALDKLKSISNPKDYTVTWWDYGYPIWYYSNTNTLIDGGKHNHDNFIISEILTTLSQLEAARLSRIAVETYVSSDYNIVADTLFKNKQPDQLDVNNYLEELKYGDVQLPKKTRDVYLYLPFRMLNIFPTVTLFSNIDLHTGQEKRKLLFFKGAVYSNSNGVLNLGQGVTFDSKSNMISFGKNQKMPVKYFFATQTDKNGKTHVGTEVLNKNGQISLIYMKSYRTMLVVNDAMLSSTFIRLFVLENYDKNLFEPVVIDPYTKIYKLKI